MIIIVEGVLETREGYHYGLKGRHCHEHCFLWIVIVYGVLDIRGPTMS